MELHGEVYLFNLSLLAITLTVVSALVMLVRQTLGGKLSNFDVYLITSFVSFGFVIAFAAILPPLASLFDPPMAILWAISSGASALLLGAVVASVLASRRKASSETMSVAVKGSFAAQGVSVFLLVVNAIFQPVEGIGLFAFALTLSLGALFVAFVRRIASLLGDKPGEDWDPRRG